jgi:hypothetical protein
MQACRKDTTFSECRCVTAWHERAKKGQSFAIGRNKRTSRGSAVSLGIDRLCGEMAQESHFVAAFPFGRTGWGG